MVGHTLVGVAPACGLGAAIPFRVVFPSGTPPDPPGNFNLEHSTNLRKAQSCQKHTHVAGYGSASGAGSCMPMPAGNVRSACGSGSEISPGCSPRALSIRRNKCLCHANQAVPDITIKVPNQTRSQNLTSPNQKPCKSMSVYTGENLNIRSHERPRQRRLDVEEGKNIPTLLVRTLAVRSFSQEVFGIEWKRPRPISSCH